MEKVKSLGDGWIIPPLRGLNDFLLEPSRFQLPNFGDLEKWGNRVVNNLVYYQTNYLYVTIAIVLIIASVNPMKVICGTMAMLAVWGECIYLLSQKDAMLKFKRSYPQVGIILTVICGSYVVYNINSVLFVLFGILLSFCVTFIHASLRLRNLKNKLANKIEGMGLERTPMGAFLSYFENTTGIALRAQTTFTQSLH